MVSGLKINLAKSEMYQIGEEYDIESLAWILGCKNGCLPATYLGLLVGASYKSKALWDHVIDRISSRLDL